MKLLLLISILLTHISTPVFAQVAASDDIVDASGTAKIVQEVVVRGNAKVESDAVLTLLRTRKGDPLSTKILQDDIRSLYDLGYFSDVRFYKEDVAGGVKIIVQVSEKPAIVSIEFKGNEEITKDNIQEKMETKLFTIVNEAAITSDVRMIERQYVEKGFYLATATYTLEKKSANEVALTFHVTEGGKVQVAEVNILGNEFYTDTEIINGVGTPGLASRPYTRSTAISSASLYQDDKVERDLQYLAYVYKDQGFAKVKVAKPFKILDPDREFVRLTFQIEEGLQYSVKTIEVSGDLLFTKEELKEPMLLKEGELFRYSHFTRDIERIQDKYGDLGYAYADVNPRSLFDDEAKEVSLNYEITKGQKIYFGKMTIVGNTKTRDNVIRREFDVADSELYSGTRMHSTRGNINRLGYFEEVQIIRERDEVQDDLMHLKVKVKEKPTGQLQAAVGFTPSSSGTQGSQWFGQGRYDEKNQSGHGWNTNLTAKWNGEENYSISAGFSDPRVNDSIWSAGTNIFYNNERRKDVSDITITERRVGGSVFVGRKIIELIRGRLTYQMAKITRDDNEAFLIERFRESGLSSSMIASISRNSVDNYIDPTSGTEVALRQQFTGGPLLGGDFQYMESSLDFTAYIPLDFTDTFRTYFKFHTNAAYIYPFGEKDVPFTERYRLGGYDDLRGFDRNIGPSFDIIRSPNGFGQKINRGGDKKILFQLEYFVPLIPEAGIKALLFTDMGRVYDNSESMELYDFKKDFGFGFRWITPIAPFRFEWAYPYVDGEVGDMEIIFSIGY